MGNLFNGWLEDGESVEWMAGGSCGWWMGSLLSRWQLVAELWLVDGETVEWMAGGS